MHYNTYQCIVNASLRRFVRIDLECEAVPDATTMLKFRQLLEQHKLGEKVTERGEDVWSETVSRFSNHPVRTRKSTFVTRETPAITTQGVYRWESS